MELPQIPKEWKNEIKGLNSDQASFDLSTHRTEMSEHRTYMSDARSHMSNERTHLAYFRTSLSLMSFGITLNRFSLFLRENKMVIKGHGLLHQTESVGLGMVVLGIVILCWALHRFRKVSKEIENDTFSSPITAMSVITLAIIALGGITTVWMMMDSH